MKIQFLGAAQNVTGSRFILETKCSRILIDCGLYQERELRNRNWEKFPVNPTSINSIILTHAHIDHCGYLPKIVKEGFTGRIFCTTPTAKITEISLLDSAKIQKRDAILKIKRHIRDKKYSSYPVKPLYNIANAKKVFTLFVEINYRKVFQVCSDIIAEFFDAGHILGSSMIKLTVKEDSTEKICIFSGDIGRGHQPILNDPSTFKKADYIFMESTYGNRLHKDQVSILDKLQEVIINTKNSGGNIVIPAFAIERTQELLYFLNQLLLENKIPHIFVFMDSPMANKVTQIFKKYSSYFDKKASSFIDNGKSPFDFYLLKTIESIHESKALNYIKGTSIILSGSGMCTGGRIKHHLINNIEKPESTILFVGYQAKGTLGREILEKPKEVRILGKKYKVNAKIEKMNGLSAHADKNELLKWVQSFKIIPKKIFIIHGEKSASHQFAETLKSKIDTEIIVPDYLQKFVL